MKESTSKMASSFEKYSYNPSEERMRNLSRDVSLWWCRDGEHVMYGDVPK